MCVCRGQGVVWRGGAVDVVLHHCTGSFLHMLSLHTCFFHGVHAPHMHLCISFIHPPTYTHIHSHTPTYTRTLHPLHLPACPQSLCESENCRHERLYIGRMAKSSEVLLQPGHKWNNIVFHNHTGLKQYPNYMMVRFLGVVLADLLFSVSFSSC